MLYEIPIADRADLALRALSDQAPQYARLLAAVQAAALVRTGMDARPEGS